MRLSIDQLLTVASAHRARRARNVFGEHLNSWSCAGCDEVGQSALWVCTSRSMADELLDARAAEALMTVREAARLKADRQYRAALDERDDCDHVAGIDELATQRARIASTRRRRDELAGPISE